MMLPLIRQEIVVRKSWMTDERFLQFLTIAQTSPGIMAVNLSLAIGWEVNGFSGALSGLLGAVLPSFFSILFIAMLFLKYFRSPLLRAFFSGAIPAVSGAIGGVVFVLGKKVLKGYYHFFALLVSAIFLVFWHVNPVTIIILGILISALTAYRREP